LKPSATLSLIGDLKRMNREFIRAAVFERYGISLYVGIGVPIPVLDEEIAKFVTVHDREINTYLYDYGQQSHPVVAQVNYADLKSGSIRVNGRTIKTAPMSSVYKARKIAAILKQWLLKRNFAISHPVQDLPKNAAVRKLLIREVK
jgi:uncharacterized protein (DUF39 family)